MDYVRALRRRADVTEIVVTAPARLHFGMLDPAGLGARRFGGFGVGIESPRVVVGVRPPVRATTVVVSGSQAERASDVRAAARGRGWGSAAGSRSTCARRSRRTWGSARAPSSGWRSPAGSPSWRASPPGPEQLAEASGRGGALERRRLDVCGDPGWWSRPACTDDGSISPLVARHPDARARGGACWRCRSASRGSPATPRSASSASCASRSPAEPRVVAAAADRAAARAAGGRHRRVRRRAAPRSSARSDRSSPPSRAACSIRARRRSSRRCTRSASGRSARARGARRSTGSSTARSGPPTSPTGCAPRPAPAPTSAWSTSTAGARGWRATARQRAGMRLLVSVVSAAEARRAARRRRGHHRRQGSGARARSVRRRRACCPRWWPRSARAAPVSVALGDLPDLPHTAALAARGAALSGAAYVKVGLRGVRELDARGGADARGRRRGRSRRRR